MKTLTLIIISVFAVCNAAPKWKTEPGPCPDYPVMENFDFSKGPSPWTTYLVYASKEDSDTKCNCSTSVLTRQPDNTTLIEFSGYFSDKPNEFLKMNTTSIPVPGKLGVFTLKSEKEYDFFDDPSLSVEMKYYVLDTDYYNYSIGICCFGDGQTKHIASATVDYKERTPPPGLLEKAIDAFKKVGLNTSNIKAVAQSNCPN